MATSLASLPKNAKLLNAADYNHVFDKPVRSSDGYFTVLARPNKLSRARLGMAFSKKRVKLAVARNRLKRISRESFRSTKEKFNADFVVLAGARCAKATNQQLFNSLEQHWQRLNKKCEKL
ncbi:MAG: ribonuclease P protein component [Gammaproteobacteria bacterium]|nr:ribonuclease P protein component [Gammaproteobacteria bacterium]MBT8133235.1 ribonuclease P protein component [Gammaproteobacteria bacterium]NNJ49323.1 ribonuclease P protein component [Gammaproteobacteria bacterium]